MEWLIPSPLKINLTLRITGKRTDGLHELLSIFRRIDGHGSITVRISPGSTVDLVRVYNYPITGKNILFHALDHLRSRGFPETPLEIGINKSVPPGTGLGAGSGEASALIAWARFFTGSEMLEGEETIIGADVPFLCSGMRLAFASGTGEKLEESRHEVPASGCVIVPAWRSGTAEAYHSVDERLKGKWITEPEARKEAERYLSAVSEGERVGLMPNDFVPGLLAEHEEYDHIFKMLETTKALAWGISGSGSSIFALFGEDVEKQRFAAKITEASDIERILFWE